MTAVPFDLQRFLAAQDAQYANAIAELGRGRKTTHWMWFILPQIAGLAMSSTSRFYAIKSVEEARAYVDHPTLGTRLIECCETLMLTDGRSAADIFGYPDDLKLHSSMTLFANVTGDDSIFKLVLEKYFDGRTDERTIAILGALG